MKLTKNTIKEFEKEQKDYGTRTALFNVVWLIAAQLLKDIGVKGVSTKVGHEKVK